MVRDAEGRPPSTARIDELLDGPRGWTHRETASSRCSTALSDPLRAVDPRRGAGARHPGARRVAHRRVRDPRAAARRSRPARDLQARSRHNDPRSAAPALSSQQGQASHPHVDALNDFRRRKPHPPRRRPQYRTYVRVHVRPPTLSAATLARVKSYGVLACGDPAEQKDEKHRKGQACRAIASSSSEAASGD
jgi:hypothetical protein